MKSGGMDDGRFIFGRGQLFLFSVDHPGEGFVGLDGVAREQTAMAFVIDAYEADDSPGGGQKRLLAHAQKTA